MLWGFSLSLDKRKIIHAALFLETCSGNFSKGINVEPLQSVEWVTSCPQEGPLLNCSTYTVDCLSPFTSLLQQLTLCN